MIAEFTAKIIANCCDTHEHQFMFKTVIHPLVNLLHSGCIKAQEAALDAVATLCRENKEIGSILIHSKPTQANSLSTIDTIVEFVKDKNPNTCLIAATCLTQFYRTDILQDTSSEITLVTLPALINLLQDTTEGIQEIAPLVLADLIKDSEEMQRAAFDADAIPRLIELLVNNHFEEEQKDEPMTQWGVPGLNIVVKSKAKIKENTLIALAAATLLKEECRTLAINSKVLPHVISGLSSKYTNIRLAACQCAKSLSRSVSHLRTSLMDAGIADPLVKLLSDEAPIVQAAACGALCNLVLEFSPVKQAVIEAGAIERFVAFTQSSDKDLQLNGVWALRNLLCKADLDAKKKVMGVLSYNALIDLLHEPNIAIQEQALEIVRNLVHGQQEDIDWVIEGIGKDDLLDVLENKLQVVSSMGVDGVCDEDAHIVTLIPALYIVVNMSSNDDPPKADLMSRSNIVNSVINHLEHNDPNVRVAAVWCIINWTWSNSDDVDEDEAFVVINYVNWV
ncbi:ARM repeat-containing protein [Backusella circina FSU 941]|nr:ARM repeat-containing protein [Backusella circina FSU 941]